MKQNKILEEAQVDNTEKIKDLIRLQSISDRLCINQRGKIDEFSLQLQEAASDVSKAQNYDETLTSTITQLCVT